LIAPPRSGVENDPGGIAVLDVAGKGSHKADMAEDEELVLYVGLRGTLRLVLVAAGVLVVWGGGGRLKLAAMPSDIILLTLNHAEALGAAINGVCVPEVSNGSR